jgi:hypothetical protein
MNLQYKSVMVVTVSSVIGVSGNGSGERHPNMEGAMACPRPGLQYRQWGNTGEDKPSPLPYSASPAEDFMDAPIMHNKKCVNH